MTQRNNEYVRLLELIAIISEEWGEAVKEINDYQWKSKDLKHLINAKKELYDLVSSVLELRGLLEVLTQEADQ